MKTTANIFEEKWEKTKLGERFASLGFHMFTIDQLLSDYEDMGQDVIRMTLGKSDRPLSAEVKKAMTDALNSHKDILRVDSEGNPILRKEIAKYYKNRFKLEINEKNVIIGSQGTSSLYRDIFIILLQNGGKVLIPKPGYILYEASAKLVQALRNDVVVDYYQIDMDTGRINFDSFANAFDRKQTRIVVLNSPGNPLGNMLSHEELSFIIDIINTGEKVVLISDQVYSNMIFGGKPYVSILDKNLLGKLQRPYIVTDSMSKGFEMYTFRVGYAIVPDEIMRPLIAFQRNFSLTPNTISQFGAIKALNQKDSVDKLCKLYEDRYKYALSKLHGIKGIIVYPVDGGFYMLICCREIISRYQMGNDLNLAVLIAKNTDPHVGVSPGSDFGAPDCLRISFSPERFNLGIDLISNFFANSYSLN